MHGMSTSRYKRRHTMRCQPGQAKSMGAKARIIGPGQGQHGNRQCKQALPQGLLRAEAIQAQARRQSGRAIALSLTALGRFGESSEHRAGQPAVDERVDVSRRLQGVSDTLVGLTSQTALFGIFQAPGGTNDDQSVQGEFGPGGNMQSDPGPERVAEQVAVLCTDGRLDRFTHQAGRGGEVGAHAVGAGMTGKVDADDGAGGPELLAEGTPQSTGLRESVQEHQRRPGPARFNMEWHVQ